MIMIADNQPRQKEILLALKKAIWTINKVIKMTEEDKYCADIASQVNASIGLLKSVNNKLLENHLKCCWPKYLNSTKPEELDAFVKELIRVWDITKK